MYTVIKNVQIIISLLKQYGIRHIVISPGSRNIAFVTSVENDPFFKTYSIVDERSAAFFGVGLIQELHEPVAICCTSGTAVCNYVSAVTEAFYQKLPLVVITADRDEYCLNQLEDQTVPQMSYFHDITKKSVNIPIIESKRDYEYAVRIANEALLELNHHGTGPVHINMPIAIGPLEIDFSTKTLPNVRKIERHLVFDRNDMRRMAQELSNAKRILVVYGQNAPASDEMKEVVEQFFHAYNCVIGVELMSNFRCEGCVDINNAPHFWSEDFEKQCVPEIVITVNGNFLSDYKGYLKGGWKFKHWLVCEEGYLADPYHKLTDIFEGLTLDFFRMMVEMSPNKRCDYGYFDVWKEQIEHLPVPDDTYCDIYAVKKFMENIPENAMLHMANSNSVRLAQKFPTKKGISVYCNRGVNGIDGSMSSFIGAAAVSNRLSFLVIGDLSFFYDMNALWNRYIGKNIRIMLNNNSGAGIFHYTRSQEQFPNIDQNIAAGHNMSARKWVESCGFKYLAAHDRTEFDIAMEQFVAPDSEQPIFLEVFTDKEENARALRNYYANGNMQNTGIRNNLKKTIKKVFS